MNTTIHKLLQWVLNPPADAAPPATLLIRLMAGGVFVGEGLLKFVFPATLGMGRFHALGIPAPELMATFVGLVELVGGRAVGAGCAPGPPASAGERRTEGGGAMTRDDRGRSLNRRTRMAMLGGGCGGLSARCPSTRR